MKIITILLLMISTQALAEQGGGVVVIPPGTYTVKQCNQIANISKRTIKAAIIGVPIDEVIDKFADRPDRLAILEDVQAKSGILEETDHNDITGEGTRLLVSPVMSLWSVSSNIPDFAWTSSSIAKRSGLSANLSITSSMGTPIIAALIVLLEMFAI
jgi:hypothetical protein